MNLLNFDSGLWFKKPRPDCQFCLSCLFCQNEFETYLICFSDPFKNEYFNQIKLINLDYVKIIQMPKDLITIVKIIKIINPDVINHQGVYRSYFMKISNIFPKVGG